MQKKFFIIMGRSGSGKGTQALFLKEKLEKLHYGDVKHVTTGGGFRALSERGDYTSRKSLELTENGGLSPEFLAIWNWSNIFMQELKEDTTVILDGAPRRLIEVEALHNLFPFYGYEYPVVIYLDVSETWAVNKLASRLRADDASSEEREKKMKWFFDDVLPCVASFKNNPLYTFVRINGERSIEEVSKDIEAQVLGTH